MEQTVALDLKQVSIKCKSKKELYEILESDCGIYMPPIQFANCGYVRGVVTGEVKHLKCKDVQIITVSQIKSLSIEDILSFACKSFDIYSYLPKYKKMRMPDRNWLCNLNKKLHKIFLVHSKLKDKFEDWIALKMKEREKMIVLKKNFHVNVLPEFKDAILKSNRVSGMFPLTNAFLVVKGRSHLLLRHSNKRKKTEEEQKEVILFPHNLESEKNELYGQVEDLKSEVSQFKMLYLENLKYKEQLEDLSKRGIIKKNDEEMIQF